MKKASELIKELGERAYTNMYKDYNGRVFFSGNLVENMTICLVKQVRDEVIYQYLGDVVIKCEDLAISYTGHKWGTTIPILMCGIANYFLHSIKLPRLKGYFFIIRENKEVDDNGYIPQQPLPRDWKVFEGMEEIELDIK